MSEPKDDAELVARSVMAAGTLSRLQDYLSRGRQYQNLSVEDLSGIWLSGIQEWCANPYKSATKMDDSGAEYDLRGLRPPYELAADDIERVTNAIAAGYDAMTESERAEANERMVADHEKDTRSKN